MWFLLCATVGFTNVFIHFQLVATSKTLILPHRIASTVRSFFAINTPYHFSPGGYLTIIKTVKYFIYENRIYHSGIRPFSNIQISRR